MIDLQFDLGDVSQIKNGTLIRLLVEYRHAEAMLKTFSDKERPTELYQAITDSTERIERELQKRESARTQLKQVFQDVPLAQE